MTGSTHRGTWLAGALTLMMAGACVQLNAEHCANQDGDATCVQRDPTRPFCSICFESGGENGCTEQPVPLACRPEGSAAGSGTTVGPSSSSSESTAVEPDTGVGTSSGGPTPGSSSTTTAPAEDSSTADTAEPFCGDGMLDQGEQCDGDDFGGATCLKLGLGVGVLECDEQCQIDTSPCCLPPDTDCTSHADCCSGMCMGLVLVPLSEGTCT